MSHMQQDTQREDGYIDVLRKEILCRMYDKTESREVYVRELWEVLSLKPLQSEERGLEWFQTLNKRRRTTFVYVF
jgi:hypothetical protein